VWCSVDEGSLEYTRFIYRSNNILGVRIMFTVSMYNSINTNNISLGFITV
jgi:hypothetical protein